MLLTENTRERCFDVDSNFEGWRLDRFLANRLGRISRDRANEIARHGDVSLRPARKVKPSMKLRMGDVVVVREHLAPERVQDDQVTLLHADDDLLVLNKPPGMLVHETATTRLNTIQHYLLRAGYADAHPAHRLDRDTSGVLVCAARRDLSAHLHELFASEHPEKVYRALVADPGGVWDGEAERTLDWPLGLAGGGLSVRMGHGPLASTTRVTPVGTVDHPAGPWRDLRVRIETGRQHQIRVHLFMAGTPIVGDKLYGRSDDFFKAICDRPDDPELTSQLALPHHALHAWRLTMPHPRTRRPVTFEAPLPPPWPQ
jgi:23S rRNA pseudouridine1911/1915/1917 synthase